MGAEMESATVDELMTEDNQPGSRGPRLVIKEMVMKNFKSYAGEQRVGPFHKSFTAVVGPNGSGKSNVIDAMLFVFGKRAKQDDGTFEAVPGSNFVITRVAFRDNSSKYYINDRTSNFTEVTKKLKGKGVDLDNNRFLILQGEVEQISLMKPKAQGPHDEGFLEYLEDIIGTNKYVEKIDESFKQLESLNEKRTGVVQMVKLAEKERDSLEGVKNEAEAYMLKELSLLKWQEKATKLAFEDNSAKIVEIQGNISTTEENLKNEREKIRENSKTLKELEALHIKYMKKHEELGNTLGRCKDEFKEFERQDVKYREDLKHLKEKMKKLNAKLDKDSAKIEDTTKKCEESTNLIPQLEEDIPMLQKVLLDEEKILEEIKEKSKVETEVLRGELAEVRAELEPWEKQLIEHRGKFEVASSEMKLLSEKHEAGRAAYEDAQKQIDEIEKKIETKGAGIKNLINELERNKIEKSEAQKLENEYLLEEQRLTPLEKAARQKLTELVSVMESEKSQGSVLKALLHAKEANLIPGIYGRMGDLGAIDAKYDIAISTACAGLDYIVVETTAAAQACVELLRNKNLGVATFMILEKQVDHLHRIKEKVTTPEGVPRLFDLVKVQDERLKLAFFAALGNTVVANDIDQATRIAYGGNKEFRRVVTLDGALFEKSGTMSGGGNKPRGGKMGSSIRPASVSGEAIASAEDELSKLSESLRNVRQKISEAAMRYRSLDEAISHLEMELAKSQKEIDSLKSLQSDLKNQMDSLKRASKPTKDEVDRLKELGKITTAEEKEIDKLTQGSKQLKDKASELQNKIENAGGVRLKNQKEKVNKIQLDIDQKRTEINRCKVQIETGQKMIKKLVKVIEESKKEKERLGEEKEKLLSMFKVIEQKAFAAQENYKKTQELINQHQDVLDKAKSDYENLKKAMDELRASEVDADYKLQDMKKVYKELEHKGKGYEKKLCDLDSALSKHMEQIQLDLVDHEKVQAALTDETLSGSCDLKRGLEMVSLLEAQLREMNPNLDSISELDEFMAGFNTISLKLKEMYQMITLGGDAELELVDSLDPFSEGVVFSVRPPKKSWKNIANLSGGEKTLSSLALVFALHHFKPTPLYVMDEIDAALGMPFSSLSLGNAVSSPTIPTFQPLCLLISMLHLPDFKNVSIVGHYVKDRTKDAQFIIISLRNNTFELADRLVGIYKTDNCTKSITINPGSFVVSQKAAA
nr:structural maintenance of chromosomes protein 4 [Ipomoea trifida]